MMIPGQFQVDEDRLICTSISWIWSWGWSEQLECISLTVKPRACTHCRLFKLEHFAEWPPCGRGWPPCGSSWFQRQKSLAAAPAIIHISVSGTSLPLHSIIEFLVVGRSPVRKNVFFRALPEVPLPFLPPIWATCTTFLDVKNDVLAHISNMC